MASEIYEAYRRDVWRRMHRTGQLMPLEIAALGLAGEYGELLEAQDNCYMRPVPIPQAQDQQCLLEAGDKTWYVVAIALHPESCIELRFPKGDLWPSQSTPVVVGRVCDQIKKYKWHGKALVRAQLQADIDYLLEEIHVRFSLETVMRMNMEKLERRYPLGFVEGGGIR